MLTELLKVAEQRTFFRLLKIDNMIKFNLDEAGLLLKQNITNEWLQSILLKSRHAFKTFVNNKTDLNYKLSLDVLDIAKSMQQLPVGLIDIREQKELHTCSHATNEYLNYFQPLDASGLTFNVALPPSEAMQFFLQWQRYRKIWWSMITTTPGLFHLSDINYKAGTAEVEILAKFPWGNQPVEAITIEETDYKNSKCAGRVAVTRFTSQLTAECALMTLLTDSYSNRTPEEYLRLHRTMAPYKVSFAIDYSDSHASHTLYELVKHLHHRISNNGISAWLPVDFDIPIDKQILKNCRLGVPYTAVLSRETLDTGIFHLMNSGTMLKEQIHIADFESYTLQLLRSCFI